MNKIIAWDTPPSPPARGRPSIAATYAEAIAELDVHPGRWARLAEGANRLLLYKLRKHYPAHVFEHRPDGDGTYTVWGCRP